MRTSCALGGRTCTSSMDSGSFGAQAIAALFALVFFLSLSLLPCFTEREKYYL